MGEPLLRHYFDPIVAASVSFVLAFAIIAYLSVVIGELVPKAIALQRPEPVAILVARPIDLFGKLAWPAVWLLQTSAKAILGLLGLDAARAGNAVRSSEELRGIVAEAEDAGIIEEAEEEMLYRVFDFAGKEAREVMVPLPEVVAIEAGLTAGQCVAIAVDAPFTRYPVYAGTLDQIVGTLHIRDLFAAVHGEPGPSTPVADLVRTAVIVPETKDLGPLLRELRANNQHLAVVVDEYGRTVGIVTLKTLLEEIVGEIEDEFQLPDASVQRVDERTLLVTGTYPVDDFNETFGTDLPTGDFHTVAGLVFHTLGRAGARRGRDRDRRPGLRRPLGRRSPDRPARGAVRRRRARRDVTPAVTRAGSIPIASGATPRSRPARARPAARGCCGRRTVRPRGPVGRTSTLRPRRRRTAQARPRPPSRPG